MAATVAIPATGSPTASRARCASRAVDPVVSTSSHTIAAIGPVVRARNRRQSLARHEHRPGDIQRSIGRGQFGLINDARTKHQQRGDADRGTRDGSDLVCRSASHVVRRVMAALAHRRESRGHRHEHQRDAAIVAARHLAAPPGTVAHPGAPPPTDTGVPSEPGSTRARFRRTRLLPTVGPDLEAWASATPGAHAWAGPRDRPDTTAVQVEHSRRNCCPGRGRGRHLSPGHPTRSTRGVQHTSRRLWILSRRRSGSRCPDRPRTCDPGRTGPGSPTRW